MQIEQTQERRQAHALLDMLPDEKLAAVRSLLEVLVEPLSRSLASAPVEEEEITDETATAIERSRARGEGISHEEIRREFGLSSRCPPMSFGSKWLGERLVEPIYARLIARQQCRFSALLIAT